MDTYNLASNAVLSVLRASSTLISPAKYCGFCLVRLPDGAQRCSKLEDKVRQKLPNKWDCMPLGHIQFSGMRGCKVCLGIFEALHQHYPDSERYILNRNEFNTCFDLGEREFSGGATTYRDLSFRLLHDATPVSKTSISPMVVNQLNPAGRTDAESWVQALKGWMDDCSRCHKQCMPRPPASNAPLPARMIKITDASGAHPMANLVDFHVRKDYICLSHCWGAVRPDCITTKETYQRNTAEIPWSSLPQTFKDAIIVTKLLGKEFLWIDSICIVQGDEHDWMAEASKMCTVYENSFLTLMATKAGDAHGGLLPKDQSLICREIRGLSVPGQLFFRQQTRHHLRRVPALTGGWYSNVFPLLRRAWVFQERCLSLRVAHFTAEGVVYECVQGFKPDKPESVPEPPYEKPLKYGRGLWSAPRNAAEFVQVWNGIVKVYSGLDLTFHSDKLPALAGLAKQLSSRSKSSGYHPGRFLAGVWENTFAEGLIWSGTNKPPGPGPLTWGAPTWSWASAEGQVEMQGPGNLSLVDYEIKLKGPDEFGEVSSLRVRISAQPIPLETSEKGPNGEEKRCMPIPHGWVEIFGFCPTTELPKRLFCILAQRGRSMLVLQAVDGALSTFQRYGYVSNLWDLAAEWLEERQQEQPKVVITLV